MLLTADFSQTSSRICFLGSENLVKVVNDICLLPFSSRVASCNGTLHLWNSQAGKVISSIAESSSSWTHSISPLSSAAKVNPDHASVLNSNPPSNGILTGSFDGTLCTCMKFIQPVEKLIASSTGNGSQLH